MQIEHTLRGILRLKPATTREQVATALTPLTAIFHIDASEALSRAPSPGDDKIFFYDPDEAELLIETCGGVNHEIGKFVQETASRISPLTVLTGYFELSDLSTGDIGNATQRIYFGPSEDGIQATRFQDDLEAVVSRLSSHLGKDTITNLCQMAIRAFNNEQDVVPVVYWGSNRYHHLEGEEPQAKFQMDIADQRASNGQLYVTLASQDGNQDNMLSVTVEVNHLPSMEGDLPCAHLHFDNDALAASFFKMGDKFIIRPETGVTLRRDTLPNHEPVWVME